MSFLCLRLGVASRFPRNSLRFHAFTRQKSALVPYKGLSEGDLGPIIYTNPSQTRMVCFTKMISLSGSAVGFAVVPMLSSHFFEWAIERPAAMTLLVMANIMIVFISFTPLLLNFLTKRYVIAVHYNSQTQVFTTVHYNFFLQKRALRFRGEEVEDALDAFKKRKIRFPLATAFVNGRVLLLSLDCRNYTDHEAFNKLTKNVKIETDSD